MERYNSLYIFTGGEYVTAEKLNNILQVAEKYRLKRGPYSFSLLGATGAQYATTITGMHIKLNDDPTYLGGIEYNNEQPSLSYTGETVRRFKLVYTNQANSGFAFFGDLQFFRRTIQNIQVWHCILDRTQLKGIELGTGANKLNLSTIGIASFRLYKHWDSLPIWNGHKYCLSFSIDENNDEVMQYTDSFDKYNTRPTIFANYSTLGSAGKLTKANILQLNNSGYEIGNNGISKVLDKNYKTNQLRLWTPPLLRVSDPTFSGANIICLEAMSITGVAHGAAVSTWNDSGPSGYQAVQANAANKPIFATGVVSGLPGVYFQSTHGMEIQNLTFGTGSHTLCFAYIPDTATAANRYLFSNGQAISSAYAHSTVTAESGFLIGTGASIATDLSATGLQLACITIGSTGSYYYRNGKLISSLAGLSTNLMTGTAYVGNTSNYTVGLSGYILDWVWVDQVLTGNNREKLEGYLAFKYKEIQKKLPHTHAFKLFPPVKPTFYIQSFMTEMLGNKSLLEEWINFSGGPNQNKNYRCLTYAYPQDVDFLFDEFIGVKVANAHLGARVLEATQNTLLTGNRSSAYLGINTWRNIRPYSMGIVLSITGLITSPGSTGTTYTNMYNLLDTLSFNSNKTKYGNSWGIFQWRDDTVDGVTTGHLNAMLDAVARHSGDFWVAPIGTVLDYYRRSRPFIGDQEWKNFL